MQIIRLAVGDIVRLRKPHPCGSDRFRVMRVGSEVRVICLGCGRDMNIDRVKLEKAIRAVFPPDEAQNPGNNSLS